MRYIYAVVITVIVSIVGVGTARAGCPPEAGTNVCYQGGTLVKTPHVYISYWGWSGGDPGGEKPALENFLGNIGGTRWLQPIVEYMGPAAGTFANAPMLYGIWSDPTPMPTTPLTLPQVQTAVQRAVAQFGVALDPNAVIVIASGTDRNWIDMNCGYHRSAPNGTSPVTPFIDLPYTPNKCPWVGSTPANSASVMAEHELIETMTDPRYDVAVGWQSDLGDEIADLCGGTSTFSASVSRGPETEIGPMWSNGARGCVATRKDRIDEFVLVGNPAMVQDVSDPLSPCLSWGNPSTFPLVGDPGSTSSEFGRLGVFVRDTGGTVWGGLTENYCATKVWSTLGTIPAPYTVAFSPDGLSMRPGAMNVFVVGLDPWANGSLFYRGFGTGGLDFFSQVTTVGPPPPYLQSGPGAVSWGPGRMDVFALDTTFPPHVAHAFSSDGGATFAWDDWGTPPGATLTFDPDAASRGLGRVEVFVVSTSNLVWRRSYANGTLGPWEQMAGLTAPVTSSPTTIGMGDNRVRVEVNTSSGVFFNMFDMTWGGWTAAPFGGIPPARGLDLSAW